MRPYHNKAAICEELFWAEGLTRVISQHVPNCRAEKQAAGTGHLVRLAHETQVSSPWQAAWPQETPSCGRRQHTECRKGSACKVTQHETTLLRMLPQGGDRARHGGGQAPRNPSLEYPHRGFREELSETWIPDTLTSNCHTAGCRLPVEPGAQSGDSWSLVAAEVSPHAVVNLDCRSD